MDRLKGLLKRGEFHLLLFHICLVLFGWPVVSFYDIQGMKVMFVYLFLVWSAVIFLLFLISRSVEVEEASEEYEAGPKKQR